MTDEAQLMDLDAAYAVDDDMQEEIDKLKADPWALLPAKDGFVPKDLSPDAEEGSEAYNQGYRERWTQTEIVEIKETGLRPLKNQQNPEKIDGQILFITYEATRGPNKGKQMDQSWWLRNGDREAVVDMNGALQEIFGKLKIKVALIKKDGREIPSNTATLPKLKGKVVAMTMQQKWDYPYTQDKATGKWNAQTDEPKKFKKRIFGIKTV